MKKVILIATAITFSLVCGYFVFSEGDYVGEINFVDVDKMSESKRAELLATDGCELVTDTKVKCKL